MREKREEVREKREEVREKREEGRELAFIWSLVYYRSEQNKLLRLRR